MTGVEPMALWLLIYIGDTKVMHWSRLEPTTYRNAIECDAARRAARASIGEPKTPAAASVTLHCIPADIDPRKELQR